MADFDLDRSPADIIRRIILRVGIILLPVIVAALFASDFSFEPPLEEGGPLTPKLLQRHLVVLTPLNYRTPGSSKYTCERVERVEQESQTYAKAWAVEKWRGNNLFRPFYVPDVKRTFPRKTVYELRRDSVDDEWYLDTSDDQSIRRFGFKKIGLGFKTYIAPKADASTETPQTFGSADIRQDSATPEEKPNPEAEIAELRKSLAALENELHEKEGLTFPDTLIMTPYKEIKCEIISETPDAVQILTDIGTAEVPRSRIKTLARATPEEQEKAAELKAEIADIRIQIEELKKRIEDYRPSYSPGRQFWQPK